MRAVNFRANAVTHGFARRGLALAAIALFVCAGDLRPAQSPEGQLSEYQVKAAFLYGFSKFIEWPDASFANPGSPFTICVIGEDPFGPALDESLRGKMMGTRNVAIVRFAAVTAIPSTQLCQIGFISGSEKQHYGQLISHFHGQSILLVGDTEGFAASGGALEFLLEDGRVRFAINPEAAARANLKVSSKLLALAKIVRDETSK